MSSGTSQVQGKKGEKNALPEVCKKLFNFDSCSIYSSNSQ